MRDYFDSTVDADKDGFVTVKDWTACVEKIKKITTLSEAQEARLLAVYTDFGAKLGASGGATLNQDQFLEAFADLCSREDEAKAFIVESTRIWFDIVDTNDNGRIELEEYTKILVAGNMTVEAAKVVFNLVDQDKDGWISMEELCAKSEHFWFTLED